MDSSTIFVVLVIVGIVALIAYLATRKPKQGPEPKAKSPEVEVSESLKPTKDERIEVDAPVEISDDMSLAEIKRAKAARVKGKGRRQTAAEATEEARKFLEGEDEEAPEEADEEAAEEEVVEEEAAEEEAAEEEAAEEEAAEDEDVDSGWDLFDDDDGGLDFLSGSAPEVDEGEEAEEEEPVAGEEEEPVAEEEQEEEEEEPAAEEEEEEEEPAAEEEEEEEEPAAEEEEEEEEPAAEEREEERGSRVEEPVGLDQMSESMGTPLEKGLERTRTGFIDRLSSLFRRDTLDDALVEDVEEVLYTADIGTRAATDILQTIEEELSKSEKQDPQAVWAFVREYVEKLLKAREEPLDVDQAKPFVILVIGVNGVGKTTTIGKMAAKYKRAGKKVLLVAGDTFRAAAVEQIEVWGDRAGIPVHVGEDQADPASVVFSGVERGVEEDFDVVICDTAGRLHTKAPLLDELAKMERVAKKVIDEAPHETILVLDANTGQNAIQQAKIFRKAVPISGIVLTKLDGTAKGGVILGICDELDAPIRYIGIGESVADLRQFNAEEFVEALFM